MKYIDFILIPRKPKRKTDIYEVVSSDSGHLLGSIRWYGPWRQYCFSPQGDTIYSGGCLDEIKEFIKELMDKRKESKKP